MGDGTFNASCKPINIEKQLKGEYAKTISCGLHHSAVLTIKKHLYVFGNNSNGQLGINSTLNSNNPINITANVIPNKSILAENSKQVL